MYKGKLEKHFLLSSEAGMLFLFFILILILIFYFGVWEFGGLRELGMGFGCLATYPYSDLVPSPYQMFHSLKRQENLKQGGSSTFHVYPQETGLTQDVFALEQ